MIWLLAAYILITLLLDWTGFSSQSYSGVEAIAKLIPSIQPYAALSPNADKTTIELVLAWIFGLALPIVMLSALDWQWINQRSARQGQLKTALLLLTTGILLLVLVLYPVPPSPSRRISGRVILSLLKSDSAFIWGAFVMMFVGLGVTCRGAAVKQVRSVAMKRGKRK
jgi:uncharacterized membrane protein YidH (DUF202 family)